MRLKALVLAIIALSLWLGLPVQKAKNVSAVTGPLRRLEL